MGFWQHVNKTGLCWIWEGATDGTGSYGRYRWEGRNRQAHWVPLLEQGHTLDSTIVCSHLCDRTLCVRPSHIRICTTAGNTLDRTMKTADGLFPLYEHFDDDTEYWEGVIAKYRVRLGEFEITPRGRLSAHLRNILPLAEEFPEVHGAIVCALSKLGYHGR